MTWVYSIRQGTIPLAWVALSLSVSDNARVSYSYYWIPPSTVYHNFSVPWNFDSENTVMSGSFTVKITADVMPGVYTLNQVSLTTRECPFTLSSTYSSGGWISYSASPALGYTLVGPTVHHIPLLTSSVETYFVNGGILTPTPPQLTQLTYTGNTSVSYGQDLKWEYKVHISYILVACFFNISFLLMLVADHLMFDISNGWDRCSKGRIPWCRSRFSCLAPFCPARGAPMTIFLHVPSKLILAKIELQKSAILRQVIYLSR